MSNQSKEIKESVINLEVSILGGVSSQKKEELPKEIVNKNNSNKPKVISLVKDENKKDLDSKTPKKDDPRFEDF